MATIRRKLVRRLVREAIRERERQGEPQVKMHDQRFRIEGSSTTPIYHLGNVDVVLKKELGQSNRQDTRERVRKLARVSLKSSTGETRRRFRCCGDVLRTTHKSNVRLHADL
jgi:hypothetical protein